MLEVWTVTAVQWGRYDALMAVRATEEEANKVRDTISEHLGYDTSLNHGNRDGNICVYVRKRTDQEELSLHWLEELG